MKEKNKLIAEFMGLEASPKYNPKEYYRKEYNSGEWYLPEEMQYHTSWDWLMPVLEKIETLGYSFEKNNQSIGNDWQSLIVKGNDIIYQSFNDDGLKSSYNVVVEFIKNN